MPVITEYKLEVFKPEDVDNLFFSDVILDLMPDGKEYDVWDGKLTVYDMPSERDALNLENAILKVLSKGEDEFYEDSKNDDDALFNEFLSYIDERVNEGEISYEVVK